MRGLLSLFLVAAVGLGAWCWSLQQANSDLRARLDGMGAVASASLGGSADPLADPLSAGAPGLDVGAGAPSPKVLQQHLAALSDRVASIEASPAPTEGGAGDASLTKATAGALASAHGFREAVRELVLEMTDDVGFRTKLGLHVPVTDLGDDPPFSRLATALALDAMQEDTMRKDLQGIKDDLMVVLSEERDDGVEVLSELGKLDQLAETDPGRTEGFIKLLTLKIPGTDETYMTRLTALQRRFHASADDYLRPEQKERLAGIKVDLFSVEMN